MPRLFLGVLPSLSGRNRKLKPFSIRGKDTISIGVRFASEMTDEFIGQLACMHMPHGRREQLYPSEDDGGGFASVKCLLGFLGYLLQLTSGDDGTIRIGTSDYYAAPSSYRVDLTIPNGSKSMFPTRLAAQEYIECRLMQEMSFRSMRRDRIDSAKHRLRASYYLATGVLAPDDRDLWNKSFGGTIKEVTLSDDQQRAMEYWVRFFDVASAEDHLKSVREIHIVGKPGSGKTERFVQFCAHAIAHRLRVLI